jgi:hypothetical protein
MHIRGYVRASTGSVPAQLIATCLAAVLLVGGALSALPGAMALAAGTCTSVANGSWGSLSTWDCGHVPTGADDVVIDHELTINSNQSANNLTINFYGILTLLSPVTLTVGGDFDIQGIFDDHVGGTVVLTGASQTIYTYGYWVDFSNLTKIAVGPGASLSVDPAVDSEGGIHILDTLTLQGTSPDYLVLTSTSPGSQWQIYPDETANVDWVDVQDSRNVSPGVIEVAHGIDSGNNVGWAISGLRRTRIVLVSSLNPALLDRPVTLTATISSVTATGTVAFQDEDEEIAGCEAQVIAGGVATCTTDTLALGSHSLTAVYGGDATHIGSTTAVLMLNVAEIQGTALLPAIFKP